jgi:dTMP kinase
MFICITGIDGSGKSTQVRLLKKYLERLNHKIFISKAYGPLERRLFKDYLKNLDQVAIMFLFQAFHTKQRILAEKALMNEKVIIADRWDDSYIVYHSQYGTLAKLPRLRDGLNNLAFGKLRPDITFLLDVKIEVARLRLLNKKTDYFDQQPRRYHISMRKGLLKLAKKRGWVVINGEQPKTLVHRCIVDALAKKGNNSYDRK